MSCDLFLTNQVYRVPHIYVYQFNAPLYFANVGVFRSRLYLETGINPSELVDKMEKGIIQLACNKVSNPPPPPPHTHTHKHNTSSSYSAVARKQRVRNKHYNSQKTYKTELTQGLRTAPQQAKMKTSRHHQRLFNAN